MNGPGEPIDLADMIDRCDHDWQLDFSGHTLMWRCRHCPAAFEARSTPAERGSGQ